ncbi:hypothetical protein ACQE3E_08990 [Methylomonas sp. MED-D]|uniref:hypothetical protein n=1 Tax=unclassified Methylomonas TaxID=2608980 RepID=UPI0028A49654|nr:hypothetical protein [Methylomonas sp. MV1]MDT4328956.1 hypothetical protein [Methylomonas sp. MV1]
MPITKLIVIASLILSAESFNVQASLTSYTTNGVDLVRMKGAGFDLSFTKDGNLFQTLANSYAGGTSAFVTAVINASGGKIYNTDNEYNTPSESNYYYLISGDFNTSTGKMSWFGAKAYVNYLNSIHYGGSQQWALPTLIETAAPACDFAFSGTNCGFNVNPSIDPLAQLYYGELSKKSRYYTSFTDPQSGYGIFGNDGNQVVGGVVGPFTNVQSQSYYAYWLGTEYAPDPYAAWDFDTSGGYQNVTFKGIPHYAWAVSPGQVGVVPVPSAVWLMSSGLLGLLGLKRRGHAG